MSLWPNKYVIGLTGNIATGKSVVRKMLEHLGAYGIDADALSHRAMMKGGPGYKPVVSTFGKWILNPDGQIDRAKLGDLVFSNPEALASLEKIIHPYVGQAIDLLVKRANQKVIVIEAIKLLEGKIHNNCDAIWVAEACSKTQISRLIQRRKIGRKAARIRVSAQAPQDAKIQAADVVIRNDGTFEETWHQVVAAWEKTVSKKEAKPAPIKRTEIDTMTIHRAGPQEAENIAKFISHLSDGKRRMTPTDVMAAFGEKAFLLLKSGEVIAGILGWQVENLVARVDDVFIAAGVDLTKSIRAMMAEVESASRELQCEATLLFLPPRLAQNSDIWQQLGYTTRTVKNLNVRAWQEAAMESMPPGTVLYFKQLRKDRVLRPV
ncbi:MAG: dephospho-CoA kinase [Chloroflexota bacterium]|nr:dephospho-CoA kinase [Chloroflexota bacterium]